MKKNATKKTHKATWAAFFIMFATGVTYFYTSSPTGVFAVALSPVYESLDKYKLALEAATVMGFSGIQETNIQYGGGNVAAASPGLFAYAHGTVVAHGKMFVGLAAVHANPFPTNKITIFTDPNDLTRYIQVGAPEQGDIQTMVYDTVTDKIYFALSSDSRLELYSLDPTSYVVSNIMSTSTLDIGSKPAIVTDGVYIYGITNQSPSTIFKVKISDGSLTYSGRGHISGGHSAAIRVEGTTTELFFGGGMTGQLEKVDARDLSSMGTLSLSPCILTDDLPYSRIDVVSGYVYVGCETTPEGYRIRTSDLKEDRFSLPGESFGMYVYGNDLYSGSFDGSVDIFPHQDIYDLHRHYIAGMATTSGSMNDIEAHINEIMYVPSNNGLYITAWWGVKGLFKINILE